MIIRTNFPVASKGWRRLSIVAALAGALLIAAFYFGPRSTTEVLRVEFAGFTNYPGMSHTTALFVISNLSNRELQLWELREVKTSDWPVYGPDMPRHWIDHPLLLPSTSFTCPISVPDYGRVWRVRFWCHDDFTKWDRTRMRWADSLRTRRLHRLAHLITPARLIKPGKPLREIVTSEMNSTNW